MTKLGSSILLDPFLQSTLLQCLLGELAPVEGSVDIKGRISYTPQEPWVFTGSLRENILFGLPYQKERYNEVVKACALDKVCVGSCSCYNC